MKKNKTELPQTEPPEKDRADGTADSSAKKTGTEAGDEKAARRARAARVTAIVELALALLLNLVFIFHFFAIADTLRKGLSPTLVSTVILMFEYLLCAVPATVILLILVPLNLKLTKLFVRGWEICAAVCVGWFIAEFFLLESLTGIPLGIVLIVSAILPNTLLIFEAYTLEKRLKEKKAKKK